MKADARREHAKPASRVVAERDSRDRQDGRRLDDLLWLRLSSATDLEPKAEHDRDEREQRERDGDPDRPVLQYRSTDGNELRVLLGDAPVADCHVDRRECERIDERREPQLVEVTDDLLRDLP